MCHFQAPRSKNWGEKYGAKIGDPTAPRLFVGGGQVNREFVERVGCYKGLMGFTADIYKAFNKFSDIALEVLLHSVIPGRWT